jgi:hypothetical protein
VQKARTESNKENENSQSDMDFSKTTLPDEHEHWEAIVSREKQLQILIRLALYRAVQAFLELQESQ